MPSLYLNKIVSHTVQFRFLIIHRIHQLKHLYCGETLNSKQAKMPKAGAYFLYMVEFKKREEQRLGRSLSMVIDFFNYFGIMSFSNFLFPKFLKHFCLQIEWVFVCAKTCVHDASLAESVCVHSFTSLRNTLMRVDFFLCHTGRGLANGVEFLECEFSTFIIFFQFGDEWNRIFENKSNFCIEKI